MNHNRFLLHFRDYLDQKAGVEITTHYRFFLQKIKAFVHMEARKLSAVNILFLYRNGRHYEIKYFFVGVSYILKL